VSQSDKSPEPIELSIGTLSQATGVPVDTLRTWERRYGFPAPTTRTEGSHRRYSADTVEQLRLIVRALELGHRASAVLGRAPAELRRLLGDEASDAGRSPATPATEQTTARWLAHTQAMDGEALLADFQRTLASMPVLQFLVQHLGPYLQAMGEAWANGTLRVSQEHFASERVREFSSAQWRALNDASLPGRATVVLATPPGEGHALGLHMAAWVVALAGAQVVFLGANVPVDEIAFAAEHHSARGVVLSVAAGYQGNLPGHIAPLAALLPAAVQLVGGGAGCIGSGIEQVLSDFFALFDWAAQLATPSA
jgi:DNA-binding transcriptional MerR regulator/methylmalonyl-CoA mutase cobalamin-binding subunit